MSTFFLTQWPGLATSYKAWVTSEVVSTSDVFMSLCLSPCLGLCVYCHRLQLAVDRASYVRLRPSCGFYHLP